MSRPIGLKRLRKVGMTRRVESSEDQESLGAPEDASKQGRILDDVEMPVEAKVDGKGEHSTKPDDSTAGEAVTTASVKISVVPTTIEEITLDQTLIQINAAKPKVVTTAATTTTTTRPNDIGVVVQEPSEFRVPQETQPSSSNDKGKGIMIEPEVPLKRKDQIALDEQIARDIQAKLDAKLIEEQKLARKQEEEANIALIELWENTQAMMEADRLLAERLQSREREELTDKEKQKLFMDLMEKRRVLTRPTVMDIASGVNEPRHYTRRNASASTRRTSTSMTLYDESEEDSVDEDGLLPVQLNNTDWGSEGYGVYKKIEGDEAWHAKFEVTTLSGRKFTRSFKTKETKRKLSGKFTSEDILKFDNFLD
ncbi:hypothetical protein Tco_0874136 [Tanacetum coccineum]|uniref:Uncharacterized protein n=1 Tax=Tanacetum coccineum TaxID=301880 RepID=A0ABQ5BKR4_9ASTR